VLAGELAPHLLADFIDAMTRDDTVRPRKINVFKDAERLAFVLRKAWMLVRPFSLMMTISPGSTSRTNRAWMRSNAVVSLERT